VGLFVPLVLGLYWKRMSVSAALASIFVAIGADLAVQFGTVAHSLGLASPPAVGIFAGLATAIAVSAMFPESRSAEIEELAGEERR
jgi:Na+/pantothenate symporter